MRNGGLAMANLVVSCETSYYAHVEYPTACYPPHVIITGEAWSRRRGERIQDLHISIRGLEQNRAAVSR